MSTLPKSYRFKVETVEHLEVLMLNYKASATEILEGLINTEYDKLMGNPELKKMIEKMNQLKDAMQEYNQQMVGEAAPDPAAAPRAEKTARAAVPARSRKKSS